MRIHAIRGQHLASLYEAFEVDFRKEPLAGTGLFAIVGPTGAGKSTLLDAVCLALYGATPRTRGNGGVLVGLETDAERLASRDPRSLLTRGCRSGYAEVEFRALDGQDYRARWSVKVPKQKATLAEPEMSVVRVADEQVVANKVSFARKAVERLVGFTFEEFQKAVLLPQGEFAEFLKADAASRAAILEKVAGGRLYSKIGELVGARRRKADDERTATEAEAAAWHPLDDAARAGAEAARDDAQAELQRLRADAKSAEAALAWHARRDELDGDVRLAQAALTEAEQQVLAAAQRRETAEAVARALAEAPALDAANTAEAARRDADAKVLQLGAALGQARAAELEARASSRAAAEALTACGEDEQRLRPAIEEAARLDTRVDEAQRIALERAAAASEAEEAAVVAARAVVDAEARLNAHAAARDAAMAWLAARTAEAPVVAEWARWRDVAERHVAARRAAAGVRARLASAPTPEAVDAAWKDAKEAKRNADEAHLAASEAERRVGVASASAHDADIRAQEARGAFDRARDVQGLDSRRAELRDGEPCPLCGARKHPYAGNARLDQLVREAELRASEVAAALQECVALRDKAAAEFADARARAAAAGAAAKSSDSAARRLEEALANAGRDAAERELRRHEQEVGACDAALAEPFVGVAGWADALRAAPATFLATWDSAAADHATWRARREAAEAELSVCAPELASAGGVARERRTHADAAARVLEEARRAAAGRARERAALLSGRATADVVADLERRRGEAERAVKAAGELAEKAGRAVATLDGQHGEATRIAAEAGATARRAAAQLDGALERLGTTRDVLASQVARGAGFVDSERRHLAELDRVVDRRRGELNARRGALDTHCSSGDPQVDAAGASAALAAARSGEDAATRRHVDALARLRSDAEARRALADIAPRLEAARSRAEVWRKLYELIGQGGQSSYRTFVQGLALEGLVAQANRHLDDLAPRYQLLRVPGSDMDLQVRDRDQADAVRAVNSLSGGETFLVSLALALGLSGLSSRTAKVESLFVDEGFGSLDPETLDVAMGVLESLQSSGRTVGIISHVAELEERVGVVVRVDKMGGGRSAVITHRVGEAVTRRG